MKDLTIDELKEINGGGDAAESMMKMGEEIGKGIRKGIDMCLAIWSML
ncbi:MAG: hypothetical protein JEZ14_17655 [Marinilabiliaceae bacterium]|nr:hypothetical protein [Marinilabiliaceae bacterium]